MNIQTPTERQMQPVVVAAASMQAPIAPRGKTAAFPTDLQGADVEALNRFNQALPEPQKTPQQAKKKKGEEEQVTEEAAASESEAVEVAQADAAGGVAEAASGSGGAAAGAGGADAVGAGAALNTFSPMLFIAPLLIGAALDDGSNPAAPPTPEPESGPTPSPSPSPSREPTPIPNIAPVVTLEHDEVKLVLNAGTGEIECAVVGGTDADGGPSALSFFFWNNGKPSTTSADGYFSIDAQGVISLTEAGEAAIGAGNPALPCAPSIEMAVVAFDGLNYSTPKTLTIDRVLPEFSTQGVDTLHSINLTDQAYLLDNVLTDLPHHRNIDIAELEGGMDLLDLDGPAFGGELHSLEMHRQTSKDGDHLVLDIEVPSGQEGHHSEVEYQITVNNHFVASKEGELETSMEFVHFQQGTTYAGYDLGGKDQANDTSTCETQDPYPFFQDHGVYLLSNAAATADGETLEGTVCNDVLVGSNEFGEMLSAGKGNDLLFAQSQHDTVSGGEGDDLIVLSQESGEHRHDEHGSRDGSLIQFLDADINGLDTIVGFEKNTRIELQSEDTSFTDEANLVIDENDATTLNLEVDELADVVSMDTSAEVNLHDWITNGGIEQTQTINIGQDNAGANLYFLVEEQGEVTITHLYHAADQLGEGEGFLSANEFTHIAQFYDVGVSQFSESTFAVIPA